MSSQKSGFLDPGATGISNSPGKSLQASLSRSLGRELATQLGGDNESGSEEDETQGEEEGEDEIIVTTQRRIVRVLTNALLAFDADDSSRTSSRRNVARRVVSLWNQRFNCTRRPSASATSTSRPILSQLGLRESRPSFPVLASILSSLLRLPHQPSLRK